VKKSCEGTHPCRIAHRCIAVLARLPRPTPQPPLHPTQTPPSLIPPIPCHPERGWPDHGWRVARSWVAGGPIMGAPFMTRTWRHERGDAAQSCHSLIALRLSLRDSPAPPHNPLSHPTQTPPSLIPPILCHPERRCSQLHREHRSRRTPTQPVSPKPPTPFSPQSPPLRLRPKAPNTRSTPRTLGVLRLRAARSAQDDSVVVGQEKN